MTAIQKVNKMDVWMARLLMASFGMPIKPQGGAAILVCIYFLVRGLFAGGSPFAGNYKKALLLSAPYLVLLIALIFVPHEYAHGLSLLCQTRASMLLVPLVFAALPTFLLTTIWQQRYWFVGACIAACLWGNAMFAYQYLTLHGMQLTHVAYRSYFHLITGIHPTYISMYLCFAICIMLAADVRSRSLKYGVIYLLIVLLLCLLAKTPILALVPVFVHAAWRRRGRLGRYRGVIAGALLATTVVCVFVPFVRQRVAEFSGMFAKNETSGIIDNSVAMRRIIWSVDMNVLHRNWLAGVGPGQLKPVLAEHYFFHSLYNGVKVGPYDPHNEYLFEWLSSGIGELLLLLVVLGVHFTTAIRRRNDTYLYLLVILCTTFFTETVLSLQQGVLLFSVFTTLFCFMDNKREAGPQPVTTSRS
jgi:O-antigen ligase